MANITHRVPFRAWVVLEIAMVTLFAACLESLSENASTNEKATVSAAGMDLAPASGFHTCFISLFISVIETIATLA